MPADAECLHPKVQRYDDTVITETAVLVDGEVELEDDATVSWDSEFSHYWCAGCFTKLEVIDGAWSVLE